MLLVQAMDIILRQAPDSFQSHVLSQLLDNILAPAESMAILEQVCRFGVRLFLAGPALAVPLCFRPLPLPPHPMDGTCSVHSGSTRLNTEMWTSLVASCSPCYALQRWQVTWKRTCVSGVCVCCWCFLIALLEDG